MKIQPYVQRSVGVRANHKLAFRYFGPFQVEKKVGPVAYKLRLPSSSAIHPVVHVSQLRRAVPPSTGVQSELPGSAEDFRIPLRVLQNRLRDKGMTSTTQVRVQWSGSPSAEPTWEDLEELQSRFPHAPAWGQTVTEGGRDVIVPAVVNTDIATDGRRKGLREIKPSNRYPANEWAA